MGNFWDTSDGQNVAQEQATGAYEVSEKLEPMPDGTVATSIATEAKWDESERDGRFISIRWDVVDGEFKNRVVFHKIRVLSADSKQRDKALRMLAAIDTNSGAGLMQINGEPSDMDLAKICNRPMDLRFRVWEMENDQGETMSGNWVEAVAPAGAVQQQPAQTPQQQADQDMVNDDGGPGW